jgi:hypothetical protein
MPGWVKVMNSLRTHPKTLAASPEACWLYVCGLCWVNEHLTDGAIPTHVLPSLAPTVKRPAKAAHQLVAAGLWHPVEGGWMVHDYLDVQTSAENVRRRRRKDADRKAEERESTKSPSGVRNGVHAESVRPVRKDSTRKKEEVRSREPSSTLTAKKEAQLA